LSDAVASDARVLSSAWLSADEGALTVIAINPEDTQLEVEIRLPSPFDTGWEDSTVERMVFGSEQLEVAITAARPRRHASPARIGHRDGVSLAVWMKLSHRATNSAVRQTNSVNWRS
jgi:hypothetical protein